MRASPCLRAARGAVAPWLLLLPLLAPSFLLATSCAAISSVMGDVTGSNKKKEQQEKVARIQVELMSLADVYAGEILANTARIPATTADEQRLVLGFQVRQATAAYEIASGSSPYAGVLDMVILASLTRWAVDAYWAPYAPGKALDPLRASLTRLEDQAWKLEAEILVPEQEKKLRDFLEQWKAEHPAAREVANVRLADVSAGPRSSGVRLGTTSELLQSFGLDPFAGLDPAVEEVQRSRVLAERAFYFAKRWPRLLELQARQLALELAAQPTPARLTDDVTRVSFAAESIARTAEGIPALVDRQREASIRQVLDALEAQETRARSLLQEIRRTLDAGTGAANALHGALGTFDGIVQRLDAPSPPGSPPGHPFDVREFTQALSQLERTATELETLLGAVGRDSPRVAALLGDAGREASERGRALVDYAFGRMLLLGLSLVAAVLVAALAYRWAATRMARR